VITWIDETTPLPPTHLAQTDGDEAPGLLAAGGRLTVERLEEAYSRGIFPWFSVRQPVLWWAPDPRMVLQTADFKLARSLRKTLKRFIVTPGCEVRIDHDCEAVIMACARTPREGQRGTWIVPAVADAYLAWHEAGHVHSVETWAAGRLVGGLYVVNLGRCVFGESMFSHATDASKISLAGLIAFCRRHGLAEIDCQQQTGHLASLGARPVPRVEFERRLSAGVSAPPPPRWAYDESMWSELALTAP
jgi:leucyl/phenylalanyl-tRNA--protein transferase